jgi:hypothetical protein
MQKPTYNLDQIKALVRSSMVNKNKEDLVFFSNLDKSVHEVVRTLKKKNKMLTNSEAGDYIKKRIVEDLSVTDFYLSRAGHMNDPKYIVDEYGLKYDGVPWFIKFALNNDQEELRLDEISFHPLKEDMKRANKTILKKDWDKENE